jgi:hypothetical protein
MTRMDNFLGTFVARYMKISRVRSSFRLSQNQQLKLWFARSQFQKGSSVTHACSAVPADPSSTTGSSDEARIVKSMLAEIVMRGERPCASAAHVPVEAANSQQKRA